MSGIKNKAQELADLQKEYSAYPNPYIAAPVCKYDHHALSEYAARVGKSINDLTFKEKVQFIKR